jgi:hypothetical protein
VTRRRVLAATAGAVLAAGVWVYVQELRYERSFYRRFLLDTGRDPNL